MDICKNILALKNYVTFRGILVTPDMRENINEAACDSNSNFT